MTEEFWLIGGQGSCRALTLTIRQFGRKFRLTGKFALQQREFSSAHKDVRPLEARCPKIFQFVAAKAAPTADFVFHANFFGVSEGAYSDALIFRLLRRAALRKMIYFSRHFFWRFGRRFSEAPIGCSGEQLPGNDLFFATIFLSAARESRPPINLHIQRTYDLQILPHGKGQTVFRVKSGAKIFVRKENEPNKAGSWLPVKLFLAGGLRGQIEFGLKQLAENRSLAPILVPLRNLAWMAVAVRNRLKPQKTYHAPIPVISVGNITVGGTGKTPFVKWLVRRLTEMGCRPAVLTPLSESADEVKEHADENLSRSEFCPVFPGRNRVENVKKAIECGATVIVLDDGFQYRSLHREVDIVLWDATSVLSPCNLLLREPLTSLRRATCIVISKADALDGKEQERLKRQLERWAGWGKVIAAFGYEPAEVKWLESGKLVESDNFQSGRVLLVAGIANPRYFFLTAQRARFNVAAMICFPDHHRYDPSDARFISELARTEGVNAILTTQKDAVKLKRLWHGEIPLLVLEVKLRWLWGEERLWETIERSVHCKVRC